MSNRIELSGFTSKDGAELRYAGDTPVARFRMSGTHQRYDRDQGKYADVGEALWYGVECWRELGEQVAEQIGTGQSRRVTVVGHIERRSYTTNAGEQRTVDEVKADSVCVHPERRQQGQTGQQGGWGATGNTSQADPWANQGGGQQSGGWGGQTEEAPF